MSDTSQRRCFQIHLSTAIVLMCAAAGILAANFYSRSRTLIELRPKADPLSDAFEVDPYSFNRRDEIRFGWPADSRIQTTIIYSADDEATNHGVIVSTDASFTPFDINEIRDRWPRVYEQLKNWDYTKHSGRPDGEKRAAQNIIYFGPTPEPAPRLFNDWDSRGSQINVAIGCAILFCVALVCEWRIRSR
jgi:hypothetical protein